MLIKVLLLWKRLRDFPNNFIKSSIAEQNAINFVAGLPKQGFKPYVYLIFLLFLEPMNRLRLIYAL